MPAFQKIPEGLDTRGEKVFRGHPCVTCPGYLSESGL